MIDVPVATIFRSVTGGLHLLTSPEFEETKAGKRIREIIEAENAGTLALRPLSHEETDADMTLDDEEE